LSWLCDDNWRSTLHCGQRTLIFELMGDPAHKGKTTMPQETRLDDA
jgi:hypothetical protein